MKLSESVKPISYLKSHTAEALRDVSEGQRTMVITQHGEAKAVLQDIVSYEQTQESLALLKMLAQSAKSYIFRLYLPPTSNSAWVICPKLQ